MKIAIATSGRFHVLDLARELLALGHDVTFYSALPASRVEAFGLPRSVARSLLPASFPFVGLQRFKPAFLPDAVAALGSRSLDWMLCRILEPCDILICMSGIFVRAISFAREKFGAKVWLERGSRHILSQASILKGLNGARIPTQDAISRELAGYANADRVVVPSRHVAASFDQQGSEALLYVNPYGVDLLAFPYSQHVRQTASDLGVIFAGRWSKRKGCDLLITAISSLPGISVTHVGGMGDCPFPSHERFVHVGHVPQDELHRYYKSGDLLVLPSREEGLSLVLPQALASGLPILCTDMTGGRDLGHTEALRSRIFEIPSDDAAALRSKLAYLRDATNNPSFLPDLSERDRECLSWSAYGRRYDEELRKPDTRRAGPGGVSDN